MDFDDLDDLEATQGPSSAELREQLLKDAKPKLIDHPKPDGKNFGPMGYMKMLYLHSMGSNKKMGMLQASNMLVNAPRKESDTVLDWTVLEGNIPNDATDHQNPEVAAMYKDYGPDFYSYFAAENYGFMHETWHNLDKALEHLGEHLKKHGPYDGIMGFDQGARVAVAAAKEAQEGNPAFQKKFRFLILCSASWLKELSVLPGGKPWQPKAPLKIPTLITYSDECLVQPISGYEELALYFDPSCRQVLKHNLGHAPPKFAKDTEGIKVLSEFIDAMRFGLPHKIQDNAETKTLQSVWLPLARAPAPSLDSAGPQARLIVVHDPLGQHGPTEEQMKVDTNRPFDELRPAAVARAGLLRALRGLTAVNFQSEAEGYSVEEVKYTSEHQELQWHPKTKRPHTWQDIEDQIVVSPKVMSRVGSELLNQLPPMMRGDRVAVVGIGTGGHVARSLASAMINERGVTPSGLWLVAPPTIFALEEEPVPGFGMLLDTSVRILTALTANNANSWRLAVSTLGPFASSTHDSQEALLSCLGKELRQGLGS
eukprot:TRINITY_DN35797_c0_g1_i1.p1 TRINITY_DN35797_c0_g1~~TRINITY_DN35797_c0_g1_i1.p1  ORF type:complete len:554 (-),score=106.98 TRINITY_DN35797_c0_g1_i1:114-1733(-)